MSHSPEPSTEVTPAFLADPDRGVLVGVVVVALVFETLIFCALGWAV